MLIRCLSCVSCELNVWLCSSLLPACLFFPFGVVFVVHLFHFIILKPLHLSPRPHLSRDTELTFIRLNVLSFTKSSISALSQVGLFLFSSNTWEAALNNCSRSILVQGVDRYARANSSDGKFGSFYQLGPLSLVQDERTTRNRWTNSSTEPLGWCACATERITPRNDSFFSSLIKDSFKINESFKTDPSLATSARAANESGSYLCASNVTPTVVRFIVSVFLCLLCSCRMSSTQMTCSHFRKNRPKKRQKPAGSDLWPVNRCIPKIRLLAYSATFF